VSEPFAKAKVGQERPDAVSPEYRVAPNGSDKNTFACSGPRWALSDGSVRDPSCPANPLIGVTSL
jgi:hypothetical protein